MEKISKEARALILDKHLTEIGVPVYGRSTRIRNDMNATAATVAGWLSGSLPSDFVTGLKFSDKYGSQDLLLDYWGLSIKDIFTKMKQALI